MPEPVRQSSLISIVLLVLLAIPSARGADVGRHEIDREGHRRANDDLRAAYGSRNTRALAHTAVAHETAGDSSRVLLGYRAVEPHRRHLQAGQAEAFRMRPRMSGVTATAHLFIDSQNRAGSVAVGIFSDAKGRPGSLLS